MHWKLWIQYTAGVVTLVALIILFQALPESKYIRIPLQLGPFVAAGEDEKVQEIQMGVMISAAIVFCLAPIVYWSMRKQPFLVGLLAPVVIGLLYFMITPFFPNISAPVVTDGPLSMVNDSYVPDVDGWLHQQTRYGLFWVVLACIAIGYCMRGYVAEHMEGE